MYYCRSVQVFDDSYLHSATNQADRPRYILHITFPHPDLLTPHPDLTSSAAAASTVIGTTGTVHFQLDFTSDCAVTVTNLRNQVKSVPQPLLTLYNKVADNRESDWDTCTAATALPGATGGANSTGSLRITAPHGYGASSQAIPPFACGFMGLLLTDCLCLQTLDIGYTPFDLWVTLSVINLDAWEADPDQKHIKFAMMCPQDICASKPGIYSPKAGVMGKVIDGLFQGWRGAEGHYPVR